MLCPRNAAGWWGVLSMTTIIMDQSSNVCDSGLPTVFLAKNRQHLASSRRAEMTRSLHICILLSEQSFDPLRLGWALFLPVEVPPPSESPPESHMWCYVQALWILDSRLSPSDAVVASFSNAARSCVNFCQWCVFWQTLFTPLLSWLSVKIFSESHMPILIVIKIICFQATI